MAKKNSIVDGIVAGLNKQFKKTVVAKGSEIIEDLKIKFIPTPSLKLNNMLGGGIAVGKIIEVFGPTGSGKTTLCYQIVGEDMKKNPDHIWGWYETEGSYDPVVAEMYGIDHDRLIFWEMNEEGAEGGLDILDGIVTQSGEQVEGIIVNSVAGLTPQSELNNVMSKADMGVQAKMMSKLMRKLTAKCNKTKCTVIFINQVRDSMSLYGGQVTTGGKALAFFASQRLEMRKIKADAADGVKETEYVKLLCKTKKNRFAKKNPYLETSIFGRYGHGIDVSMELLELAIEQNIIEKKGGGNYLYIKPDGSEQKWRGASNLMAYIDDNPDFVEEIKAKLEEGSNSINSMSEDEIREVQKADEMLDAEFNTEEDGAEDDN